MGYAEIINPLQKVKTIYGDEVTHIKIEYCDKCESWQDLHSGAFQRGNDGLEAIAWFCGGCK